MQQVIGTIGGITFYVGSILLIWNLPSVVSFIKSLVR